MDLKIASHAGFCFGVRRAVETTQALLRSGEAVYTLGPMIHNPQVVASLEAEGARVAAMARAEREPDEKEEAGTGKTPEEE